MTKTKTKTKILIVEDEVSLLEMYKIKFQNEGFDVLTASNGLVVLDMAKKEKPSAILLDIMLPKLDGFAALKQLKGNTQTKKIPVILLTNLGQDEDMTKGKKMGAEDYIVKTDFTPAQVMEKIKSVIKKK